MARGRAATRHRGRALPPRFRGDRGRGQRRRGQLIFQGRAFAHRVAAEPPTIDRALELAREHEASMHATVHHLVETHPAPCALLVVGRFPCRDRSLPVWRTVYSPSFRRRFGPARLPTSLECGTPLHGLAEAARGAGRAHATVPLEDRSGRLRRCDAQSYYNRHTFLVLLHHGERGVGVHRPSSG